MMMLGRSPPAAVATAAVATIADKQKIENEVKVFMVRCLEQGMCGRSRSLRGGSFG